MNILILGSGGREYALARAYSNSSIVGKVFISPGGDGFSRIEKSFSVKLNDFSDIAAFCRKEDISFVIPGSETFLAKGICDFLNKEHIPYVGPNKEATQLESSKIFTKRICVEENIPTANFNIIKSEEKLSFITRNRSYPIVIKKDGLASGKGVFIVNNFKELEAAIFSDIIKNDKEFLAEEFLTGEECSVFYLVRDEKAFFMGTAKDYKREFDGNLGRNTGGMGSYSPCMWASDKLFEQKVRKKIVFPVLKNMSEKGILCEGILFVGLIKIKDEPYLLEFNFRLGDPETQSIIPLIESDIANEMANFSMGGVPNLLFKSHFTTTLVVATKGYPGAISSQSEVPDPTEAEQLTGGHVYLTGVIYDKNKWIASSGRAVNIVSTKKNLSESVEVVYNCAKTLNWQGGFYRRDIGSEFKV